MRKLSFASSLLGLLLLACPPPEVPGGQGDSCDPEHPCTEGLNCVAGKCILPDSDAGLLPDSGTPDTAPADSAMPDAGPMGACDQRVTFDPVTPNADGPIDVYFSDDSGYSHVSLHVHASGAPVVQFVEFTSPPSTWQFQVTGCAAGNMELTFTMDQGAAAYACEIEVLPGVGPTDASVPDALQSDAAMPDAGTAPDGAMPEDATTPEDAAAPVDATTPEDATAPVDAATPEDAGSLEDAAAPEDV